MFMILSFFVVISNVIINLMKIIMIIINESNDNELEIMMIDRFISLVCIDIDCEYW